VRCSNCQTEVQPGQKFCPECGNRLDAGCSSCGAPLSPTAKFCAECGTPTQAAVRPAAIGPATAPQQAAQAPAPVAERRLVSVLFADLVGFTAASEDRDPEETRELLSRYFELARERIGRYGGVVEKFIGDAVMAVWGAPTAFEDDAERAVRAALDLVAAVPGLGGDGPPIAARAGVLTGEAAVTIGAEGQGMVAGDLVNTAARLQSVADPGTVLVGESTRDAANASIVFDAAGERTLKGKGLPVPAWRALRVVAGRAGQGRSEGLEAPFVGRDEELALLKDLFHATTREGRARLVSITGQAGIGKSRLAWEFEKYVDGLVETVRWHQGRSPAYGEGVTFWALGEMVRRRAEIAEGEGPDVTQERVRTMLRTYVPTEEDQRRVEPAILALLGIEGAPDLERGELFTAWRTLFEGVAATGTAVLVIEDLQWADAGLIDFLESLVTWSRNHPILVITLARPELLDLRPGWGGGQRNFTSLHLEPLAEADMRLLLDGLVPGLPPNAVRAILERAEGVPLYAVETVRMLVADGSLVRDGDRYVPARALDKLSVPQTLHALVAARLDGLAAGERSLLQDASVLGLSFTLAALAAVTGTAESELRPGLDDLARREWLRIETDARSPERGQYQFMQSVIREVAYSTLAKRDRRQRHLAAARYFEGREDAELAGVLATHYVSAYRSTAEGPEADALAAQARVALRAAADRALSLASPVQAVAFLTEALTVTTDPAERAALLERAGDAAIDGGRYEQAIDLFEPAIAWHAAEGHASDRARDLAAIGTGLIVSGRLQEAIARLAGEVTEAGSGEDDAGMARLTAELARAYMLDLQSERAIEIADRSIAAAERLDLVGVMAEALITKGTALGRTAPRQGMAMLFGALKVAAIFGLTRSEIRAANNLGIPLSEEDPRAMLELYQRSDELATRLGSRDMALRNRVGLGFWQLENGELEAALAIGLECDAEDLGVLARLELASLAVVAAAALGRGDERRRIAALVDALLTTVTNPEYIASVTASRAQMALLDGDPDEAYRLALEFARTGVDVYWSNVLLVRSAVRRRALDDARVALQGLLATARRGRVVQAGNLGFQAAVSALEGDVATARERYRDAERRFRDLAMVVSLTELQLDMAYALAGSPEGRPFAQDALETFERIGAPPLADQAHALLAEGAPTKGRARTASPVDEGSRVR
jgi:class 3 adenylate cyclase/tetratricopeptide (TPR) repeat protein